jgi:lysophospholipase L1-like esterase
MTRPRVLFAAALASITTLVLAAVPAQGAAPAATPPSYVALGDSYSAGTGAGTYLDDGTSCRRSPLGYPSLIASANGYHLDLRACSGAEVRDVRADQFSALSGSTDLVTISVGGNDAGFAKVLISCGLPAWASNCYRSVDGARAYIRDVLPGALRSLYADIRTRAPRAKVTVVGYARLFNGEDCNPLTFFSDAEQNELNATADLLNATTRDVAVQAGLEFAEVAPRFVGHTACDDDPWLSGLVVPAFVDSYHPNPVGYAEGYVPEVGALLTGVRMTVTGAVRSRAEQSAERLAARQRGHAASDRSIAARVARMPTLDSPEVRDAAARAGVDLDSPASIAAADASWDARQFRSR